MMPKRRSLENAGTVGDYIDAIYSNNPKEEFLGEPKHHYDFTQSEEWANAHGYYPDKRGHRDDRVKKPTHPSHPSRGTWEGNNFILTNKGLADPNYIFFGLNDGGQDPQAILKYKDTYVIPEVTVTPKGSYINNSYDNIRLHFKEGGKFTNYTNTIGLGYILSNYGKKTIDYIRKKLYDNVQPWGYNDIPQRAYNAIVKNKKEVDETKDKALRDDLWATYLQIPKKERHNIKGGKVTLEKANYSPKGANPNKEVYKFKDLLDVTKFGLLNYAGIIPYSINFDSGEYLPIGKNRVVYPKDLGAFTELEGLGQFTVGRGYDKKGDYVSYYDSWDLGETDKNPYKDLTFGIGRPFNVYDRIYLDDYFGVPTEHKGGIYLPEVLVNGTRKKHRNGGSINIAPSKRGTFTTAATKHDMGVQEFASKVLKNKDSYSPAMVKKANFARNASKWNH